MRIISKHALGAAGSAVLGFTLLAFGIRPVSPPGGGDPHWAIPIEQYLEGEETGIVDFSYAGYMANERALPNAPVKVVVTPSAGDDGPRIQAALDYVGRLEPDAQGVRGAVLLEPGDYEIFSQLILKKSGVILRGSGPGQKGTRLIAIGQDRRTLIRISGRDDKTTGTAIAITEPVLTGSAIIKPADVNDFKPGDPVFITHPSTEEWIMAMNMSKIWNAKKAPRIWKAGELDVVWDRQIKSIDNEKVILDAPLSMDLDPNGTGATLMRYNWPGRICQVGIENLQLISAYEKDRPTDEDHAWVGVTLEQVRDAWVRGVTFRHFAGSAVSVWESASRITVVDCESLEPVSENGGWRRHTFFTSGQQTLFLRCYSEDGRHDFSVGHCAAGPNAFVHCDARRALDDSGPIGALATGVLYDNVNIDGNGLRLGYRGAELQFSGWTAIHCMLWQSTASQLDCYRPPQGQ
ncbi:MAG TPA: pectate lyase, partial [Deltaproteobacteria bacterium]|nr:pectate lyase [Deltaproteobacteria bacterium]